ncbi:hypothetical protein C8J56DRAFT_890653 [Mycena floridula]|nr:hypothetical protein C8J56DRAFT_890653 [Mycena floridula]
MLVGIDVGWDSSGYASIMGPSGSCKARENLTSKPAVVSPPKQRGLSKEKAANRFPIENTIFPFRTSPPATSPTPPTLLAIVIAVLKISAYNVSAPNISAYLGKRHAENPAPLPRSPAPPLTGRVSQGQKINMTGTSNRDDINFL